MEISVSKLDDLIAEIRKVHGCDDCPLLANGFCDEVSEKAEADPNIMDFGCRDVYLSFLTNKFIVNQKEYAR